MLRPQAVAVEHTERQLDLLNASAALGAFGPRLRLMVDARAPRLFPSAGGGCVQTHVPPQAQAGLSAAPALGLEGCPGLSGVLGWDQVAAMRVSTNNDAVALLAELLPALKAAAPAAVLLEASCPDAPCRFTWHAAPLSMRTEPWAPRPATPVNVSLYLVYSISVPALLAQRRCAHG